MTNPAFQAGAFQTSAFQTGYGLVAATYVLEPLEFASPQVRLNLPIESYSLGSPEFAAPAILILTSSLSASSYTLSAPSYAAPALAQLHYLTTVSYTLSPLAWIAPLVVQDHRLISNRMAVAALDFAVPVLSNFYAFSAPPIYTLGVPIFATVEIKITGFAFRANNWSLDYLRIAMPRLQVGPKFVPLPPFFLHEVDEAVDTLGSILKDLLHSVPSTSSEDTYSLRHKVGSILAQAELLITSAILGEPLRDAFATATEVGATLARMDLVRQNILERGLPRGSMALAIAETSIVLTLVENSRIILAMTFRSREDVQFVLNRMYQAFDQVKSAAEIDSPTYIAVNTLGGSLTRYLVQAQLELPRLVTYVGSQPMPVLYIANRIYGDASRYEEIVLENKIIHPGFCPIELRVLSE